MEMRSWWFCCGKLVGSQPKCAVLGRVFFSRKPNEDKPLIMSYLMAGTDARTPCRRRAKFDILPRIKCPRAYSLLIR